MDSELGGRRYILTLVSSAGLGHSEDEDDEDDEDDEEDEDEDGEDDEEELVFYEDKH